MLFVRVHSTNHLVPQTSRINGIINGLEAMTTSGIATVFASPVLSRVAFVRSTSRRPPIPSPVFRFLEGPRKSSSASDGARLSPKLPTIFCGSYPTCCWWNVWREKVHQGPRCHPFEDHLNHLPSSYNPAKWPQPTVTDSNLKNEAPPHYLSSTSALSFHLIPWALVIWNF